nr:hypothetical protein [Cupriavidus sp. AcVe19-6a]
MGDLRSMYGPSAVVSAMQLEHSFGEIDAKDIDFHDDPPTCQVEVDSVHRREDRLRKGNAPPLGWWPAFSGTVPADQDYVEHL